MNEILMALARGVIDDVEALEELEETLQIACDNAFQEGYYRGRQDAKDGGYSY